jgi:hypothetical protein
MLTLLLNACDGWHIAGRSTVAMRRRPEQAYSTPYECRFTVTHAGSRRRAWEAAMCASSTGGNSQEEETDEEEDVEEATLYKKRKGSFRPLQTKDNRDQLLYKVTEITPPPRKLGNFRLGPSAGCGDLISARVRLGEDGEKSEQTFVIKKVSYRYEYQRGAYRMVGKAAGVKAASRDAVESVLNRMLPDEAGSSDVAPQLSDRTEQQQGARGSSTEGQQ